MNEPDPPDNGDEDLARILLEEEESDPPPRRGWTIDDDGNLIEWRPE